MYAEELKCDWFTITDRTSYGVQACFIYLRSKWREREREICWSWLRDLRRTTKEFLFFFPSFSDSPMMVSNCAPGTVTGDSALVSFPFRSSFDNLWTFFRLTTMIRIVHFLKFVENISHVKNHIDRIPFYTTSKCINFVIKRCATLDCNPFNTVHSLEHIENTDYPKHHVDLIPRNLGF